MASWSEIEAEAPELVAYARERFEAATHHTLATLRRDGSPRISGTELKFADGDLWVGSMWRSMKALDLRRDPRFALHAASQDPPDWQGDAKVAGTMEEVIDETLVASVYGDELPPGSGHAFRANISELVTVRMGDPADHIVIESWHQGRGVTRVERT
jgi:hypothetical protein